MTKPKTPATKRKTSTAMKKSQFESSPVTRAEVNKIKDKLREEANKGQALKIAKAELATEKRALQKQASLALMEKLRKLESGK